MPFISKDLHLSDATKLTLVGIPLLSAGAWRILQASWRIASAHESSELQRSLRPWFLWCSAGSSGTRTAGWSVWGSCWELREPRLPSRSLWRRAGTRRTSRES